MKSENPNFLRIYVLIALYVGVVMSIDAFNEKGKTGPNNVASSIAIIYVKKNVQASGNGKSWTSAYKYLREALDEAPSFIGSIVNGMLITDVEIWVAQGTYYPDEPVSKTILDDDRSLSFTMLNNVQIYGGFSGNETSLTQRDWVYRKTYLSGDIDQNDYINDFTGNSYRVVENFYASNDVLDNSSVLDGFIVTAGYANGPFNEDIGAGIFNYYASPVINNCIIRGNHADKWGGATFAQEGTPEYVNCLIYQNTSLDHGAVAYNFQAYPKFQNCTITQNTSLDSSTGIYNVDSDPLIYNTILWNNREEIASPVSTTSIPDIRYSIVQGGYPPGFMVIDDNPRFENPFDEDYYLGNCSPAIGNGDNSLNSSLFDYNGTNRVINTTIDIGAYEHTVGTPANFSTIYVDVDATGSDNGTNWTNAYNYLQDALTEARSGGGCKQIWVAEGEYYPDEGNGYTDNAQDSSFTMLNDVEIYGGFLGSELVLNDRDWYHNETILSGDIDQNEDTTYNAYHVIKNMATLPNPITSSSILDGFVITQGNAIGDGFGLGGGILNNSASPLIQNCTIKNNFAIHGGGASNSAHPIFLNCVFYKNIASYGGAVSDGQAYFINCSFSQNTALIRGGAGFYSSETTRSTFINSILWDNWATSSKELDYSDGVPKLNNCIIEGGFNGYDSKDNLDLDPKFLDILSGDLRVSTCSPAIDAGIAGYNSSPTDQANNPRIVYNGIDIGAYEHQTPSTLNIIYVDSSQTSTTGLNGNSWSTAYRFLQDALREANVHNGCTQVWVAKGTYYPDEGQFEVNNNRNFSFKLYNNTEIYGGFVGYESDLSERDWMSNRTILSGDIDNDNEYFEFMNSEVVIKRPQSYIGINNSSILDGFSVLGGYASFSTGGGGIRLDSISPKILNCSLEQNFASRGGGGFFIKDGKPIVNNCQIKNNQNSGLNSSKGGGVKIENAEVLFINCSFENNSPTEGVEITSNSKVTFNNSVIQDHNGGIFCSDSELNVINSSFSNNEITITAFSSSGNVVNSIITGTINISSSDIIVDNCIIHGGYPTGTNILVVDPMFSDTTNGDLTLMACSPAIDAGENTLGKSDIDLAGNPRLYNATGSGPTIIDIGAYEYQVPNTGCCMDNLVLSGSITSGTYKAALSILCDGVISAGADVIFNAPEINLTEDFEVEDTGQLETQTAGCSNN